MSVSCSRGLTVYYTKSVVLLKFPDLVAMKPRQLSSHMQFSLNKTVAVSSKCSAVVVLPCSLSFAARLQNAL